MDASKAPERAEPSGDVADLIRVLDNRSGPVLFMAKAAQAYADALRAALAAPGEAEGVRVKALREAAQAILDGMFTTYRARNGRQCSIETDDGEMAYLVHSDLIEDLRYALSALASPQEDPAHGR